MREDNISEEEAKMKLYYTCDVCGKSYANKSGLKAHILHVHEKYSEEVPCDVCGISFRTRDLLKQHQEREHSECPKYACETCGQRFGNSYHLKRHEVIHTDEEFPCGLCSRRFKRKDGLDTHMSHMHPSQLKQYQSSSIESQNTRKETFTTAESEEQNFTELIPYEPNEFCSHENETARVIDPFKTPNMTSNEISHGEDISQDYFSKPRSENIMSQIDNLSQYKSTPVVKTQLEFDIQVCRALL